jgi:hypothetical protein|tara:strand:+ start:4875 stop:5888 length:1014 start_codon:yes stop_codon:yes gene_type:complete
MPDFWLDSGYRLLDKTPGGHLAVTDDFLRAYLMRPEMEPVEESCEVERALHARLLENPKSDISSADIAAMADDDIKENYQVVIGFRDRLVTAETVEDCYLGLFKNPGGQIPPLFINQLTQIILHNILADTLYPLWVRCGEMLFREQKITLQNEAIMAADADTVDLHLSSGAPASLEIAKGKNDAGAKEIELDVLSDKNAEIYWDRSDNYDTVLDLRVWGQANTSLCRVMERWVNHFYQVPVNIQPLEEVKEDSWVWHIGLDTEATALLNDLYNGNEVAEERNQRLVSLFRMEIRDETLIKPDIAGRPIYLGMAMTADNLLRLKPQNLLVNLPLAESA